MEQLNNNWDVDSFNKLFPDGDYSSVIDDIHFSDYNLNIDQPTEDFPWLPSNDRSTDGISSTELIHLIPGTEQGDMAILDKEPFTQNQTVEQNFDTINIPLLQQASGSENGIMYQMHPSLFDGIGDIGGISVRQQPKANNRLRYQSDGSRFLPDSRYHPISINLSNLQSISLTNNQTLGIVMTLVTTTDNPKYQTFVHANDIFYREPDAVKIGYGCVYVPLKLSDMQNYEKKFPRLSIVYKKCEEYTFDLTPFDTFSMFGITEKYTITDKKKVGNAAKGKDFKKDYNLLSYKIIFQLALKQDNVIYISNITCDTDPIHEKKASETSRKRSSSCLSQDLSEEEISSDTSVINSSKKFKSSTPVLVGLPVTRVPNIITQPDMDHGQ